MFQSITNESDISLDQSINEIDYEYEKSQLILKKNVLDLDESDYDILKNSMLFKNWNPNVLKFFLDDNRILLKKYKYKDIIAKEEEYENNIYILKSGDAKCYIKINRSQIKNHQKILESNSTTPYFLESSIDKQRNKFLRENLLNSQSNNHSLKSKYLDFTRQKTFTSQKCDSSSKSKDKKVSFNHFETLKQSRGILKNKPLIDLNFSQQKSTTFMVKPMSAISDKQLTTINENNLFRSVSSHMVRSNRTIKFIFNKKNHNLNSLNKSIDVVTDHNSSGSFILKSTPEETTSDLNFVKNLDEFEACNRIKTKNPEVWSEIYQFDVTNSCFVRLLDLKPGEIFGLSDFLFDEKRQNNKLNISNYENRDEHAETESQDTNKYHLIVDSKFAECYIIDKEAYLKYMLTFTTDKTVINKYLDQMRDTCLKLPSVKTVNENFFQDLTWKLYKRRAYNQLVNLSLRN